MKKRIKIISAKTKDGLVSYLKKIWEIINKPEMGLLPGQLAFFMFLSLVPIATLIGFGAGVFNINMNTITNLINDYFPQAADLIVPAISGASIDFKLAGVFLMMFYIASNGCNSVILISNQIYGIEQSTWLKRRIKAIFMTLAIVIVMIFILVVPVFGEKIISLFGFANLKDEITIIIKIVKGPLSWLLMFIFIRSFYEFAPDRVRKNTHMNTGALFTTIGWIIGTNIYSFYVNNMSRYNLFYGALSNLAVLIIWIYFLSFIFVIGLSLNHGEELDKQTIKSTGAIKVIKAD